MMTSSEMNSGSRSRGARCKSRRNCGQGNWTGINIAAMVVGFVFFWPVGLVVLFWILTGRNVRDLPGVVQSVWARFFGNWGSEHGFGSDNVVFDEYQQTQYDRIAEIKTEIRERARRFDDFKADAKRRADEAEFNQFMASAPASDANS